jgi:hypothetical protein
MTVGHGLRRRAAVVLLAAPASAQTYLNAPILRVETGTHTAPIRAVDTDRAGLSVLTASDDKTARLWRAASWPRPQKMAISIYTRRMAPGTCAPRRRTVPSRWTSPGARMESGSPSATTRANRRWTCSPCRH